MNSNSDRCMCVRSVGVQKLHWHGVCTTDWPGRPGADLPILLKMIGNIIPSISSCKIVHWSILQLRIKIFVVIIPKNIPVHFSYWKIAHWSILQLRIQFFRNYSIIPKNIPVHFLIGKSLIGPFYNIELRFFRNYTEKYTRSFSYWKIAHWSILQMRMKKFP